MKRDILAYLIPSIEFYVVMIELEIERRPNKGNTIEKSMHYRHMTLNAQLDRIKASLNLYL